MVLLLSYPIEISTKPPAFSLYIALQTYAKTVFNAFTHASVSSGIPTLIRDHVS
jgi:hypothetical protein